MTHPNSKEIISKKDKSYSSLSFINYILLDKNKILLEQLETICRIARIGFWSLDLITNNPTWSEEVYTLFGFNPKKIVPNQIEILKWIHPEDRENYIKLMETSLSTLKKYKTEIRILHSDGSYRWFYVAGEPVRQNSTTINTFSGIVMEITERKEAELELLILNESLHQSETLFREFAENIHEVFWRVTPSLDKVIYVSPAYEKIWGRSCESLYKNPTQWFDAIIPEDKPKVKNAFGPNIIENDVVIEFRITRSDGSIRYIFSRGFPLCNKNGDLIAMVGIATDITEYKQINQSMDIQLEITKIIENHTDLKEIIRLILRKICITMEWDFGEVWLMDFSLNVLRNIDHWHKISEKNYDLLDAVSASLIIKRGQGLPGKVWQDAAPVWIADITKQKISTRTFETAKANLNSAFGVPIIFQKKIFGVINFFNTQIREPNDWLLKTMQSIGTQLGDFIQRKYTEEQILLTSHRDVITGLLNRATFEETLNDLVSTKNYPLVAVFMFNIDRFGQVMTAIGHDATDILLQKISERLRNFVIHDTNNSAHLAADRFALYLQHINTENDVLVLANKILDIFKDPFFINGEDFFISTHIGIALYPKNGLDGKKLIENAYIALQLCNSSGKNNIQFYSEELPEKRSAKFKMETSLRQAILKNELCLYYQPKVHLKSGKVSGLEALIRWNHPQKGLLTPSQFMPLAEESGLIIPISEWAFQEVCKQTKEGWSSVPIAINISAQSFKNNLNLIPFIKQMLGNYAVQGNKIEIELTESILLENTLQSLQILTSLRNLGLTIALDDFGTGFSSFNYLLRIPADTIKIDKSFIDNIPNNPDNVCIVNAIISLSHSLKKKIVAEGVETIEQFNFLVDTNCDYVQGYYISPPLPLDQIKTFLNLR